LDPEFHFHIHEVEAKTGLEAAGGGYRMANPWREEIVKVDPLCATWTRDHLMAPFECDFCVFQKLRGYLPRPQFQADRKLMACIRRSILDVFWSRESKTVAVNCGVIRRGIILSEEVGLQGPYLAPGPLPAYDHCGYE
jgi:hypothetical protein